MGSIGSSTRWSRRSLVIGQVVLVFGLAGIALAVLGYYSAQGSDGDAVGIPAAGIATVVLWLGLAWLARRWFALFLTWIAAVSVVGLTASGFSSEQPGNAGLAEKFVVLGLCTAGVAVLLVVGMLARPAVTGVEPRFELPGWQHRKDSGTSEHERDQERNADR